MKIKHILSILTLSYLFLISCEREDNTTTNKTEKITYEQKTFSELRANKKFTSAYYSTKNKIQDIKKNGRTVMENLYNFVIDTSFVNIASNPNYTSYTFNISRTNQNKEEFENLLIEVKNNNVPKAFLLKYKLNADDNYTLLSKKQIEYNLNEQGLVYYGPECYSEIMVISVSCSGPGHHYDNSNGDCTAGDFYSITLSREVCSGGGGSEMGDDGGGFTPTTNPSTGGSGSGSTQTSYTYTMPPLELKRKTFLMNLKNNNLAAYNWLRTQSESTQGQIYNYLANTGTQDNPEQQYSQEKCYHIEQLILLRLQVGSLNHENFNNQITSTLPICLENVLTDLKLLQNGKFGQVIKKFSGTSPIPVNFNWNVVVRTLPNNEAASTSGSILGGNAVSTTINSNYVNVSTDISLARTLIHECFHAYLVSIYRYRTIDTNYVNLINTYLSQFNNSTDATQHHVFVVSNIINEIAISIKEYGNLKGYNLSQQYCNDMAWAGLLGTNAYNNLSQTDKDRIESTLAAEQYNNSNNTLGYSPKGIKPCP